MNRKLALHEHLIIWSIGIILGAAIFSFTGSIMESALIYIAIVAVTGASLLIPVPYLEIRVESVTDKNREEIEEDLLGEESIIVDNMERRGLEFGGREGNIFNFRYYPTFVHRVLDREITVTRELEKTDEGFVDTEKAGNNPKIKKRIRIEEKDGESWVEEISVNQDYVFTSTVLRMYLEKENVSEILTEEGYDLKSYKVKPSFTG